MKTHTFKSLIGLTLIAGLVVVAAQADAPPLLGIAQIGHTRIGVIRNDDGTVARGTRNQMMSSNWSGYALANYSTGQTYTAGQLSWIVPQVSYVTPPPICHALHFGDRTRHDRTREICISPFAPAEYSASWVGIGGDCENSNCTAVDNTLIQLGTSQNVSSNGATEYYAWIEKLPDDPVLVSPTYPTCKSLSCAYRVQPGDAMTATLTCQSNCTPGASQSWLLTMSDKTQNWSWSTVVTYRSTLLSVEWIQEAPSSFAGVLPLADFGTAGFVPTINNNQSPSLLPGDAILMIDPYGETSDPSSAESTAPVGAFNTCWGNNPKSIVACATP